MCSLYKTILHEQWVTMRGAQLIGLWVCSPYPLYCLHTICFEIVTFVVPIAFETDLLLFSIGNYCEIPNQGSVIREQFLLKRSTYIHWTIVSHHFCCNPRLMHWFGCKFFFIVTTIPFIMLIKPLFLMMHFQHFWWFTWSTIRLF